MEIGDKVRIIIEGELYANFTTMFERFNFNNKIHNNWNSDSMNYFTIFNKGYDYYNRLLYAIKNEEYELLIGHAGIELIPENELINEFTEREKQIYAYAYKRGKDDFVIGNYIEPNIIINGNR